MTEIHITDPAPFDDDIILEQSLRPSKFDEFIGQNELVDNLKLYIEAANKRGESLDHVLLFGPPGLGKTTLAKFWKLYLISKCKIPKLIINPNNTPKVAAPYDPNTNKLNTLSTT